MSGDAAYRRRVAEFREAMNRPLPPPGDSGAGFFPDGVADWLANLAMLRGVPIWYLIPDSRMLPPESIRFFQLDPNWIEALLDGALSVGRAMVGGGDQDVELTRAAKRRAMAARHRDRARRLGLEPEETAQDDGGTPTVASGFLLRSAVVNDVPKMVVKAFSDAALTQQLPPLRLEQISPGLLVGVFPSLVAAVTFTEPPQGLHYGFNAPDEHSTTPYKNLRDPATGKELPVEADNIYSLTDGYPTTDGADWNSTTGVVSPARMAANMKKKAPLNSITILSDQFGMQMVEGSESVTALVTPQEGG